MYKPIEVYSTFAGDKKLLGGELDKLMQGNPIENNDMLDFLFSRYLLSTGYKGKHRAWNDYLLQIAYSVKESLPKELQSDVFLKTFVKETMYPYLLTREWSRYRQVYLYDPVLEEALLETDEFEVECDVFNSLPYNCLYIEFHKDGKLHKTDEGVFVNILKTEDKVLIYSLGSTGLQSPFTNRYVITNGKVKIKDGESEFTKFLLNALMYLCAENAEIDEFPLIPKEKAEEKENDNTENTEEKFDVVTEKNIRRNSCGYRFGSYVRMIKEKKKNGYFSDNTLSKKGHKQLIPHIRRGHYHHYRVGKGRTNVIIKWIQPTMVGNFFVGEEPSIEATIHKVC